MDPGVAQRQALRAMGAWPSVGASPQRALRMGTYDGVSVVTPSDLKGRADQIDAFITSLSSAVENAPTIDTNTASQFAAFANAWQDYYNGLGGVTGWFKRLWGTGTSDTLDSYQAQAQQWAQKLRGVGAPVATPDLPPPANTGDSSSTIKWLVAGGVLIVGGFVAMKAFDLMPRRAHATAGVNAWKGYAGHKRRRRRHARKARGIFGTGIKVKPLQLAYAAGGAFVLYQLLFKEDKPSAAQIATQTVDTTGEIIAAAGMV